MHCDTKKTKNFEGVQDMVTLNWSEEALFAQNWWLEMQRVTRYSRAAIQQFRADCWNPAVMCVAHSWGLQVSLPRKQNIRFIGL